MLGPPESTPAAPTGVNVQQATLIAATQSVGSTATGFTLRILPSATPGLMWNYDRIGALRAWNATTGPRR